MINSLPQQYSSEQIKWVTVSTSPDHSLFGQFVTPRFSDITAGCQMSVYALKSSNLVFWDNFQSMFQVCALTQSKVKYSLIWRWFLKEDQEQHLRHCLANNQSTTTEGTLSFSNNPRHPGGNKLDFDGKKMMIVPWRTGSLSAQCYCSEMCFILTASINEKWKTLHHL